jgi:hypothetical protein
VDAGNFIQKIYMQGCRGATTVHDFCWCACSNIRLDESKMRVRESSSGQRVPVRKRHTYSFTAGKVQLIFVPSCKSHVAEQAWFTLVLCHLRERRKAIPHSRAKRSTNMIYACALSVTRRWPGEMSSWRESAFYQRGTAQAHVVSGDSFEGE